MAPPRRMTFNIFIESDAPTADQEAEAVERVKSIYDRHGAEYHFFFYDDGETDWRKSGNYHFETFVRDEGNMHQEVKDLRELLTDVVKPLGTLYVNHDHETFEEMKDKDGFRDLASGDGQSWD